MKNLFGTTPAEYWLEAIFNELRPYIGRSALDQKRAAKRIREVFTVDLFQSWNENRRGRKDEDYAEMVVERLLRSSFRRGCVLSLTAPKRKKPGYSA